MINRLFDNKIGSLALVIIIFIAIRIPIFTLHQNDTFNIVNNGIFSKILNQINHNSLFSFILSSIVIFIEGLLINKLCWEYNVVEKPGYIVFYFFAILNSCFIENFYLSNIQIGNMFVLIGMNYLYLFIKNNYDRRWLFLSALFYGLAALSIPEHFWIIVFLIVIVIKKVSLWIFLVGRWVRT